MQMPKQEKIYKAVLTQNNALRQQLQEKDTYIDFLENILSEQFNPNIPFDQTCPHCGLVTRFVVYLKDFATTKKLKEQWLWRKSASATTPEEQPYPKEGDPDDQSTE